MKLTIVLTSVCNATVNEREYHSLNFVVYRGDMLDGIGLMEIIKTYAWDETDNEYKTTFKIDPYTEDISDIIKDVRFINAIISYDTKENEYVLDLDDTDLIKQMQEVLKDRYYDSMYTSDYKWA